MPADAATIAAHRPAAKPWLRSGLRRVLVVAIDHHLGNTVLTLPVVSAFADYFVEGVDVLVDQRYSSLVRDVPGVRHVWEYPAQRRGGRKTKSSNALAELTLMGRINASRYFAVIDVTGGIRASAVVGSMALRGTSKRIGFSDARRGWVYSRRLRPPDIRTTHVKRRYAAMLRAIASHPEREPVYPDLRLPAPKAGLAEADRALTLVYGHDFLERDGGVAEPLVLMHPSAGIAWRQWPSERFAAVAGRLANEANARVAVIGTPGEQDLAERIRSASGHADRVRFVSVSLNGLRGLFERASLLVSNESGPTHLAALTDLPIVTIFGPTPELQWRPIRERACTVLRGAACDPSCFGRTCVADLKCLDALSANAVADAALAALARAQPTPTRPDPVPTPA